MTEMLNDQKKFSDRGTEGRLFDLGAKDPVFDLQTAAAFRLSMPTVSLYEWTGTEVLFNIRK